MSKENGNMKIKIMRVKMQLDTESDLIIVNEKLSKSTKVDG